MTTNEICYCIKLTSEAVVSSLIGTAIAHRYLRFSLKVSAAAAIALSGVAAWALYCRRNRSAPPALHLLSAQAKPKLGSAIPSGPKSFDDKATASTIYCPQDRGADLPMAQAGSELDSTVPLGSELSDDEVADDEGMSEIKQTEVLQSESLKFSSWIYKRTFINLELVKAIRENPDACAELQRLFPAIQIKEEEKGPTLYFYCTTQDYAGICELAKEIPQLSPLMPILDKGPTVKREERLAQGRIYFSCDPKSDFDAGLMINREFSQAVRELNSQASSLIRKSRACDVISAWKPANSGSGERTPRGVLFGYLRRERGVCIGEAHVDPAPKRLLIDSMQDLHAVGVSYLFLEHVLQDHHQALLDAYFANPNDGMHPLLESYLKKIPRSHEALRGSDYVQLVKSAVAAGIRVVALDTATSYQSGRETDGSARIRSMNHTAQIIMKETLATKPNAKYVALVGNTHCGTYGWLNYEESSPTEWVSGLAELMKCPAVIVQTQDPSKIEFGVSEYLRSGNEFINCVDAVISLPSTLGT